MILAYVFWHRGTGDAYEARLARFHAALAADPPPGFTGSRAFRLDRAPWLPGEGDVYEDWYAVGDWGDLGTLNAGAVSGSRRTPHDEVAGLARAGAAGIYRGPHLPEAGPANWIHKPQDTTYAELTGFWMRQMVLGPAPEFCGTDVPKQWRPLEVQRTLVAS